MFCGLKPSLYYCDCLKSFCYLFPFKKIIITRLFNPIKMDHNTSILELEDPERQQIYQIILSREDYERALTDENYANSLLFHARVNSLNKSNPTPDASSSSNTPATNKSSGCIDSSKTVIMWGYNQTTSLINSMATHHSDLSDPKKRKHVFDVCNDLISNGFTVSSTMVQNKWKSLLRSYHKAKDTKNRTGQGPPRFLFFDCMDDLLGQRPSNKCDHSVNSMVTNTDSETEHDTVDEPAAFENSESNEETEENSEQDVGRENRCEKKRKRLSEKKIRKEYIDLKLEEYKRRKKRHEEKMEIEQQKLELEKRKVTVLEEYIKYRKEPKN